jgi:hypothetical protein
MAIELSDVISVDSDPDNVALLSEQCRAYQLCDSEARERYDP